LTAADRRPCGWEKLLLVNVCLLFVCQSLMSLINDGQGRHDVRPAGVSRPAEPGCGGRCGRLWGVGTGDQYGDDGCTDGVVRAKYRNSLEEKEPLTPEEVYELDVELRPTAHTFQADHRIRVQVTSSNFPRIDRNPNQAMQVSDATEDDMETATQTIHHSEARPSRLQLPVMDN
jgi:hypothetical protein